MVVVAAPLAILKKSFFSLLFNRDWNKFRIWIVNEVSNKNVVANLCTFRVSLSFPTSFSFIVFLGWIKKAFILLFQFCLHVIYENWEPFFCSNWNIWTWMPIYWLRVDKCDLVKESNNNKESNDITCVKQTFTHVETNWNRI